MLNYPFSFPKISGKLLKRINRFVVEVEINGQKNQAYLANPGRLWELFLPGTELLLNPNSSKSKLPYTVLACRKENQFVLLHTHLANKITGHLLATGSLTPFKEYRVVKEEPACARHRFDLLLQHKQTGESYYLEIKSCTLFAGRLAMFPDAVTRRGSDHLCKLHELSTRGIKTGCLFLVMNPDTQYFLPAYHIDPAFAKIFMAVKESVQLKAVAVGFDHTFTVINSVKELVIPFSFLNSELQDRGAYLLLIKINSNKILEIGSLGQTEFEQGYYIYTGSAMQALSKRVARHTRKKKKKRWHIDYLVSEAETVTPVSIISSNKLECDLAANLNRIAEKTIKGFGASDCNCAGHLFYFMENPLYNPRFIDLVQYYRLLRLEEKIELIQTKE